MSTPKTTYEDATRCPKCNQPGHLSNKAPQEDGSSIHVIDCANTLCPWFETPWFVQVMPDGTIPVREPGAKTFRAYTPGQASYAQSVLEQITLEDPTISLKHD